MIPSHTSILSFDTGLGKYVIGDIDEHPRLFSYEEDGVIITEQLVKDYEQNPTGCLFEAKGKWSTMKRKFVEELGTFVVTLFIHVNITDKYREIQLFKSVDPVAFPDAKYYISRQEPNFKDNGVTIISLPN